MTLDIIDDELDDVIGDDGQLALPRVAPGRPSTREATPIVHVTHGPQESYWVDATREQLRERVAARQPAMRTSRFWKLATGFLAEKG